MSRHSIQRSPQVKRAPLIALPDNDDEADALISALIENRHAEIPQDERKQDVTSFNEKNGRGEDFAHSHPRAWRGTGGCRY